MHSSYEFQRGRTLLALKQGLDAGFQYPKVVNNMNSSDTLKSCHMLKAQNGPFSSAYNECASANVEGTLSVKSGWCLTKWCLQRVCACRLCFLYRASSLCVSYLYNKLGVALTSIVQFFLCE